MYHILAFLSQFEVWLCIDYRGSGNHLLIKVQVDQISWCGMCHLDVLLEHIDKWSSPNTSHEHEVQHYVLHGFCPVFLMNLGHFKVVCFLVLQLPLMLLLQHKCAANMSNAVGLGAMFHWLEHKCCKLEVLCHHYGNLIPPVQSPPTHQASRLSNNVTGHGDVLIREAS